MTHRPDLQMLRGRSESAPTGDELPREPNNAFVTSLPRSPKIRDASGRTLRVFRTASGCSHVNIGLAGRSFLAHTPINALYFFPQRRHASKEPADT